MEDDRKLFARAPLDGEMWRDALVHGAECPWCRDLGSPRSEGLVVGGDPEGTKAGNSRGWMVALSAVTVFAAVLSAALN
ncbi:hypothetical protein ACFWTC_29095 [Streptomyces sp. NPDC058619]|uniref:hypothetical protein n=1 Tax=unclassified Streptomyces TaxID=2593676 RepID=UPI00364BA628